MDFRRNKLVRLLILKPYMLLCITKGKIWENFKFNCNKRKYFNKDKRLYYGLAGVKFYLPECDTDLIQRSIVVNNSYYEEEILKRVKAIVNNAENMIALDIGANIGNHSLFFAKELKYKEVHAFEPIESTYNILIKNVDYNNYRKKIITYKVGVGDKETKASIDKIYEGNRGGTSIKENINGNLLVRSIDSYSFKNVGFLKIDTEGFEDKVLLGASDTIDKFRPIVWVEVRENNLNFVSKYFFDKNYKCVYQSWENRIYVPE